MKKIIIGLLLCLGWHSLMAQAVCGTNEMMQQMMKKNPSLRMRMEQYNKNIRQHLSSRSQMGVPCNTQEIYTIRVVVHVMKDGKNGDVDNVTEKQITDAIEYLNTVYSENNTGIKFELAAEIDFNVTLRDNANYKKGVAQDENPRRESKMLI